MLFILISLVLCLFLSVGSINSAEKYPSRPVIIVSPFVPGGALSTIAHITGRYLEKSLGVPFVVDNKPGGGTVIGTAYVANAPQTDIHFCVRQMFSHRSLWEQRLIRWRIFR
jgi:tripartite-type tricarboxylate transporter receptor subunit TctC